MCGIVGYIGNMQAAPILLDGLSKLEYRGYDSSGIAVYNGEEIEVVKSKGRLKVLSELTHGGESLPGTLGIGHTRWATHGSPSDINAHPLTKEGHIVGNHTEHHPDMSAISSLSAFQQELSAVEASYAKITGESLPAYYRPPQGKYSPENLKQADELGYATIFWSLAYVDWNQDDQPTKEEAFEKLLGRIHPGAVVLLHSTSEANASYLGELLDQWKALGYRFGTLDELTGQDLSSDDPKADPGGFVDV